MNKSDQIGELATALNKAQAEFGPALKDSSNPFFKSKYADLSSVWSAASEPLAKNGLAIVQTNRVEPPMPYIDREGHNALLITVVVETVLMHTSGQWISGECLYPCGKNDAQAVGSAITYGRRYGLQAMLGIVADDDDGNAASPQPKDSYDQRPAWKKPEAVPDPPPAPKPLPPAVDYLGTGEAKKKEAKLKDICTKLNKARIWMQLDDMTDEEKAAGGLVYNSETLNRYCLSGFDTPLAQLSKEEVAVLLTDLTDTLEERLALQGDDTPALPSHSGTSPTEKQLTALEKLTGIKGKVESQVAEEASGGRCGTFAALTEAEAEQAIIGLTKA